MYGSLKYTIIYAPLQQQTNFSKKRRANREDNLIAMHVPQVTDNVQLERAHRRVATRGIVALFNAIAKHQQQGPDTENHNSSAMKGGDDKVATSKYSFMEKLKETAANKVKNSTSTSSVETKLNGNAASSNSGAVGSNSKSAGRAAAAGWDALKDDFMMGSKLKVRLCVASYILIFDIFTCASNASESFCCSLTILVLCLPSYIFRIGIKRTMRQNQKMKCSLRNLLWMVKMI